MPRPFFLARGACAYTLDQERHRQHRAGRVHHNPGPGQNYNGAGLFADDEGVSGGVAFFGGAVPEDAIGDQRAFPSGALGEEDLQRVA